MSKFFRLIFFAALIFCFNVNCSAAVVGISNDDLTGFMEKCNNELKASDPNASLDTPKPADTFKRYTDTLQIAEDTAVKITYTARNDKIFSIRLDANKFDDNVKGCFEGLNIIFLKALGLTDSEAKALSGNSDESEWQCEGYITRLQKRFIVKAKSSTLTITADDKQKS